MQHSNADLHASPLSYNLNPLESCMAFLQSLTPTLCTVQASGPGSWWDCKTLCTPHIIQIAPLALKRVHHSSSVLSGRLLQGCLSEAPAYIQARTQDTAALTIGLFLHDLKSP